VRAEGSPKGAGNGRTKVFGIKGAHSVLPLSPREERVGREPERGEFLKNNLLSPTLSSLLEEEREKKWDVTRNANPLPNTIAGPRALPGTN